MVREEVGTGWLEGGVVQGKVCGGGKWHIWKEGRQGGRWWDMAGKEVGRGQLKWGAG